MPVFITRPAAPPERLKVRPESGDPLPSRGAQRRAAIAGFEIVRANRSQPTRVAAMQSNDGGAELGVLYRDEAVPEGYVGYYAVLERSPRTVFRVQAPSRLMNGAVWDRLSWVLQELNSQADQSPKLRLESTHADA